MDLKKTNYFDPRKMAARKRWTVQETGQGLIAMTGYAYLGDEEKTALFSGADLDARIRQASAEKPREMELYLRLFNWLVIRRRETLQLKSHAMQVLQLIWREPGQVTNIPKYGETSLYSTAYLENASYLRLKNLSLSYQLPQSLLKKTGFIQGVKFSVVMRNLWTLTNYTGYDPEYDSSIIYGMYPNTRQYSFGLELVF